MRPIVLVMSEGSHRFARRKLHDSKGSFEAAQALLRHTIESAEAVGEVVVCAPSGSDAAAMASERGHPWIRQGSGSIGAKIRVAMSAVHARTPDRPILLLGDDCPGLTEESVASAVIALEHGAHSVVGRARDGGFWLLGLVSWDDSLAGSLAANVEWCTPRAHLTLCRFLSTSFPGGPAILPELADLDGPEDLAEAVRAAEPDFLRATLAAVKPGQLDREREPSIDEPWLPPPSSVSEGLPRPPPPRF